MKQLLFVTCLLAGLLKLQAQEGVSRIANINPDSVNYNDLSFLKNVLQNAAIVGLGEQSHGDGATFDAKVRIIKYLHENLGYDVLAFESGYFDCTKANDGIQKGQDAEDYLFRAIFGIWKCRELKKLAAYLNETREKGHPLLLTGFDCQFAGSFSKTELAAEFTAFVRETEARTGKSLQLDTIAIAATLGKVAKYSNFFTKLSVADTALLSQTVSKITDAVNTAHLTDGKTASWLRICYSILVDVRRKFGNDELRDSMMAENAGWLLNEKFKGHKVIMWAASAHLAYNTNEVEDKYFATHTSMGTALKRKLGSRYYSILFTSYQGKSHAGIINLKVGKPRENGVEQFFFNLKYPSAFADLSYNTPGLAPYLNNAKVFGHRQMNMPLQHITDGIVYIENMYPANY